MEQLLERLVSVHDSTLSACIPDLIEAAEHTIPKSLSDSHRWPPPARSCWPPMPAMSSAEFARPTGMAVRHIQEFSAPKGSRGSLAVRGGHRVDDRLLVSAEWDGTRVLRGPSRVRTPLSRWRRHGWRPHVRPVLGVWVGGSLHTTSSPTARKARNLALNDRCSFSVSVDAVDVVLERAAEKVVNSARLQPVADAYASKYGWPPTVKDGAFDAPYGAPTAGPPPYEV